MEAGLPAESLTRTIGSRPGPGTACTLTDGE
jgi:hypothetical protein